VKLLLEKGEKGNVKLGQEKVENCALKIEGTVKGKSKFAINTLKHVLDNLLLYFFLTKAPLVVVKLMLIYYSPLTLIKPTLLALRNCFLSVYLANTYIS